MREKKIKYSKEKVEQLKKSGVDFRVVNTYYHDCPFCGKHVGDENEKRLLKDSTCI